VTTNEMPLNRPPDYARLSWLDDDTLRRLRYAESQLKNLSMCASLSSSIQRAPALQKVIQQLQHPLSSEAMANALGESNATQAECRFLHAQQRTAIEINVLRQFKDAIALSALTGDATRFVKVLEILATHSRHQTQPGENVEVRVVNVNILPDRNGAYWQCVPASEVMPRLAELHTFIQANLRERPLLTAIVALVMIVAIHPFGDSNGRVSRILFNGLLQVGAADQQTFIPLKEIYEFSEFGFEIRLRHCMRFNEWSQIARYFCDVIDFCLMVQASGDLHRH
jgi:Fic family protein